MSGRRRYLVSYDISDPKRLRKVHNAMKAYGWPMHYSVFISDLDSIELIGLKTELGDVIHHSEDTIAFVDLGMPTERGRNCFDFLGNAPPLPSSGPVIV